MRVELTKEEILQLFEDFINENFLWGTFEYFLEMKGYTLKDLNFPEE